MLLAHLVLDHLPPGHRQTLQVGLLTDLINTSLSLLLSKLLRNLLNLLMGLMMGLLVGPAHVLAQAVVQSLTETLIPVVWITDVVDDLLIQPAGLLGIAGNLPRLLTPGANPGRRRPHR